MDNNKSENRRFGKSAIRKFLMSALSMVLLVPICSSMALPALSVTDDGYVSDTENAETEIDLADHEIVETPDEPDEVTEEVSEEEQEPEEQKPEKKSDKNYVLSKATPASGTCGAKATWTLDADGVLTISGEGDMQSYNWNQAPWLGQRNNITKIVIEEGITRIGTAAFHASSVKEVEIAASVKYINYAAFYQCTSLTDINIIDTEETPSQLSLLGQQCFSGCNALEEVTIPGNITQIDNQAFESCAALKHVTLSEGIKYVGAYMFRYCKALETVELPDSVTTIRSEAFNGTALSGIKFPSNITELQYAAFYNCDSLTEVEIPETVKTVGTQLFDNCSNLVKGNIPTSWTSIPNQIYRDTKLAEIEIHDGITSIGNEAFKNTQLTEVTIPDSVTSFGDGAFRENKLLEKINIPDGVETIPGAFIYNCPLITEINLPDSVKTIGNSAFESTGIKEIEIPDGVTTLGGYAFKNCKSLKKAILPDSITSIGVQCFYSCTSLEELKLPANITSIPNEMCRECTSLKEVNIPDGVVTIGTWAFAYAKNVETLVIPDSVTTIYEHAFRDSTYKEIQFSKNLVRVDYAAFYNCDNLTEVELPDTITTMGTQVFDDCSNLVKGNIPKGLTYVPACIYRSTKLAEIELHDGITTINESAFQGTKIQEVTIPETVETIGVNAFRACTELWEIDIPTSVKTIGNGAFYNCNRFTDVYIPEGVETIGNYAFMWCSQLQNVIISDTVKTIGSEAFRNCAELRSINIPEGVESIGSWCFYQDYALKKVHLPDSLTFMGERAFQECTRLTEINIPNQITRIQSWAFYGCSSLQEIEFPDSLLSIGREAFRGTALKEVRLNEGFLYTEYASFGWIGSLKSVIFPSTMTSVGQEAFRDTAITEVIMYDGLKTINYAAFYNCNSLKKVVLPESITSMSSQVFDDCDNLVKCNFPSSLTSVPAYTFRKTSLAEITIPEGVTVINEYAFNNTKLKEVTIPNSVKEIKSSAFDTTLIKEVTIPENAKTFGEGVFANNPNLEKVNFTYDMTEIPKTMFYNCGFKEFTLPASVQILREGAFNECKNLKKFTFPENSNITTLENNVFGSKMTYFYNVPADLTVTASSFNNTNRSYGVKLNVIIDEPSSSMTVKNRLMAGFIDTVTVDTSVQTLNASLLRSFMDDADTRLYFKPNAHFELTGNVIIDDYHIISLLEGEYIADANGILYRIEDGKANVAYCPPEPTEVSIPAKVGDYEVAGIESNAFASAKKLTKITFASPKKITTLKSLAFAHAENLVSINGKTKDLDVVAALGTSSLYDTEAIKFKKLFVETKITATEETHVNKDIEIGKYDQKSTEPYVAIKTAHYLTSNTVLDASDPNYNYALYTGQSEMSTIIISPQGSRGYKYSVFLRFLDNYGKLNLPMGKSTFKTPAGNTYEVYVSNIDGAGFYRIDFPELIPGDTLSVDIVADVASPISEGDTLLLWGEIYAPDQTPYTVPDKLPDNYQRITWETKPKTFGITANNWYNNGEMKFNWNGKEVTLQNAYYFAPTDIKDIALDTIGSDYVRSIDYKFTITIPEGTEFKPEYIDAIQNGKWKRAVIDGNTSYFYVDYNGTWAQVFAVSTSARNSLSSDGNGNYQPDITGVSYDEETQSLSFYWTVINDNENKEIATHYNTTFINGNVIRLTDEFIDDVNSSATFKNLTTETSWEQTVHYTYSADQTAESSRTATYQIKPAQLRFTKTRSNWDTYMGYYSRTFTLKAENLGITPYKKIRHVEDVLNEVYYVGIYDIYKMFMTDTYGEYLKISVKGAKFEPLKGDSSQYTVMGTDGWTHQLTAYTTSSPNSSMTDEEYFNYKYGRGAVTTTVDHPDYSENHTLTFTREGENIVVVVDGKDTYRRQTAEGLAELYEELGYFVHLSDIYTVEWNMPETEWIYGDPLVLYVRINTKSTFMMLNVDTATEHPYIGWKSNTASVYDKDGSLLVSDTDRDESFLASASDSMEVRWGSYIGENSYVTYGLGNYTTLSTRVRYFEYNSQYNVVPFIHHIHGAALALIPSETTWNRANKQLKGLEKYKYVDGNNNTTWYYKLDKPGEYRNVSIGGYLADKVVVQVTPTGYDYFIYWYFAANGYDSTVTIPIIYTSNYKTKAATNPSGSKTSEISGAKLDEKVSGEGEYTIYRESWLNDHELHRLYTSSSSGSGKIITGSKYIVTERGETPEEDSLDTYSIVHANDKVTYRLSVKALGDVNEKYILTVLGKNLYDLLPESSNVHEWEKGVNVLNVEYIGEDGKEYKTIDMNGTKINAIDNGDDWYITYNGRTQVSSGANAPKYQWLTWGDDFRLRLYDETVYIYITLEMPDKEIWEDYADSIKGSSDYTIKNSLYVYQNTQNAHTNDEIHTVSHELALQGEAMLNKGVVGTGRHAYIGGWDSTDGWNEYNKTISFFTQTNDSRKYYVNDDYYQRDITYYISIYNSGKVRLYIDDLYDVLPKGFTFKGNINYSLTSIGASYSRTNEWQYLNTRNWDNYKNIAVVQSEDGKNATYKRGYIYADTEMLDDGRQKINFHIRKNTWGYDDFNYDPRYDNKVYLSPGQALVFCYSCYTNGEEETEDYANSEVAMKHFNYNDEGVRLSNGTVYGRDMFTSERNDGAAYLLDDGQAKGHGFMNGNTNTQWLFSEVAVRRGGIEPGITDFVDGIYHTDESNTKAESNSFALFTDKITWRNTAYNDGNYTLTDYTLTNVMQRPFRFLDTIDLSWQYSGNYYNSRPNVQLMEFTEWAEDSSWVKFKYNGQEHTIDLDNEWHYINYNEPTTNDEGEEVIEPSPQDYEIRMVKDPATGDMTVDFRLKDKWWSIPEHGNVKLYCSTKVPQGDEWENKSFYNNAFITPNSQTFDERNITKGISVRYSGIEEDQNSVKNSTQLPVSYGNSTSSYIKVEMTNDAKNAALSTEDENFIILPNTSKDITYTMNVTSQKRPLVQLIAINNLPDIDDHETFNTNTPRNSKFKVNFAQVVAPKVIITEENKTTGIVLDPSLYTVQYSDKTEYNNADWEGRDDGWYDEPTENSRSIRFIILDDTGTLMKVKAKIDMSFNSVVEGEPTQGQFAWDTFGYHCTAYNTPVAQEAAPTNVGVGVPSIPFMEKKLTDEANGEWNAEEDVKCRFIIYKSEEIRDLNTLENDEEIAAAIEAKNVPYTYCELEVKKGESKSESLSLDMNCFTYSDGKFTETEEPFEWTHNAKYTVMELPLADNNYAYGDINDSTGNTHTFTYNHSKQKYITAKNKFKLWRLGIIKTDEAGNTLAGAAFGLYSPFEYDRLTDEQVNDLTSMLTPYSDGSVLFDKPIETEIELDGKTYYLKDIKESPENGTIVWGRLRMTDYAVTEIHAPEGYHRDTTFYIRKGKEFEVLSITVVNDKILGYKLPDSGGYVLYLYLTGILTTALPTYMLYRKLRRRKSLIR